MKQGVLITGGSGFLARGLVRKLLESGCDRICLYSRGEFAQAAMRIEFNDDPRLRWFIGDVRDKERLERAMESVHHVILAAALKRIETCNYNPEEVVKTNVIGTSNAIWAARKAGVQKVLLVSTDKAFEPVSPYGQTKALAESLCLSENILSPYGPRYAVCRFGNVAGSTGSVIPIWREILKTSGTVPLSNPEVTRFWMLREEAVNLVLDTLRTMVGGEVAIPELPAYRLGDLAEAMNARVRITGLGEWEKLHEKMAEDKCSKTARRMSVQELQAGLKFV